MNSPSEQAPLYPSIREPDALPRCSVCGGVASSDPCVSCRPVDAADTESGRTVAYVLMALIVAAIVGVAWCIKCS